VSVQLVSKISNLCDPDPPTSQTDRRTDGQHAISIPRYALVHRAVKSSGDRGDFVNYNSFILLGGPLSHGHRVPGECFAGSLTACRRAAINGCSVYVSASLVDSLVVMRPSPDASYSLLTTSLPYHPELLASAMPVPRLRLLACIHGLVNFSPRPRGEK